jgi:hypothetical protein
MQADLLGTMVVALLGAGCVGLSVGPVVPRPNVMVSAEDVPEILVLAPAIVDDFVVPPTVSIGAVSVRGWRRTLIAAYQNAFPRGEDSGSGRQLELLSAELSFGRAVSDNAAVIGMIRFKARVLDAAGKELGNFAGTAKAREVITSWSEVGMTDNASQAVEALYETLATELLSKT